MAAYDEVDDEFVDFPAEHELEGRHIHVCFRLERGRVVGRVLPWATGAKPPVSKIVFPAQRDWHGPQPTDGQEIRVFVARDTKPDEPDRGALIVTRQRLDGGQGGTHTKCGSCGSRVRQMDAQTGRFLRHATCPNCNDIFEITWPSR